MLSHLVISQSEFLPDFLFYKSKLEKMINYCLKLKKQVLLTAHSTGVGQPIFSHISLAILSPWFTLQKK